MGFADAFISGTGGGGFTLPSPTAFSFPTIGGNPAFRSDGTQQGASDIAHVTPYLNLWNQNIHNIIDALISTPNPGAADVQSTINQITKNSADLVAWISSNLRDETVKKNTTNEIEQATKDLLAELTALLNRLNNSQTPAVPGSTSTTTTTTTTSPLWWLLLVVAVFIILFALASRKKN